MNAPRWFWSVLAGCLALVSLALAWRLVRPAPAPADSWQWIAGWGAFNARTATLCFVVGHCRDMRTGAETKPGADPLHLYDTSAPRAARRDTGANPLERFVIPNAGAKP